MAKQPQPVRPSTPPAAVVMQAPAQPMEAGDPAVNRADVRGPGERVPFGSQRLKLAFPERPGYARRVFNDEPGRIEAALNAGYTHVKDEKTGEPVRKTVGVSQHGGGLQGYLMEIPIELYQQDQADKQARVDEFDRAIREGANAGIPGQDGRYVPKDAYGKPKIKIESR